MKSKKIQLKQKIKRKQKEKVIDFSEYLTVLETQEEVEELTYFIYLSKNKIVIDLSCGGGTSIKKKGISVAALIDLLKDMGVQERKNIEKLVTWEGYDKETKVFKTIY